MTQPPFLSPTLPSSISRRSLLRAALVGAAAVGATSLLAACTPGGAAGGASGSLVAAKSGTAAGSVAQLLLAGGDPSTPSGKAIAARVAAWTKTNPDAKVVSENIAFDQMSTTALTRARARKLADVVQLYPGTLFDSVFPVLAPVTPAMFPDIGDAMTLWDYTTLEPTGSAHAGVPIGNQGASWYYNKRLFEKAGLDPEKAPQTWEELISTVDALKRAGLIPLAMSRGYAGFYLYASILVQFLPEVQQLRDFRSGKLPIDSEEFRTPLKAVSDMARGGWFHPAFLDKEDDSALADFAQGNVAMYCAQLGSWADIEANLPAGDFGAFIPPKHPEAVKKAAYVTPDTMFCLTKNAANPEAALSWIQYLGTKEAMTTALKTGGVMPNRTDIDVASIVSNPSAGQIADWLARETTNEVPLDFFNGTASATFYAKLPTTLVSGDIGPFLSQLATEQKQKVG